jgi:DHA2 family multidrug resistance protein
MAMTAIGMGATMLFTPQMDYHHFVILRVLQVVGLPFLFVPTSTMAFSSIPREKSSKASALFSLMRNLGGSFGISILLSFLTRHEQIHQTYLAQHLTPADPGYQASLSNATATIMANGTPHAAAAATAMGRLYQQLLAQASILSYGDAFQMLAAVVFVLAIAALFLPRNKVHKPASGETVAVH